MRKCQIILGHLTIAFSSAFLTLLILNGINPAMQFLAGHVAQIFLGLFCLFALALGIVSVVLYRKNVSQHPKDRPPLPPKQKDERSAGYWDDVL